MIKNRYIFSTLILSSAVAVAADLNPSAGPADTLSYTLQDICNRLGSGEKGTQRNFTEPTSGPADFTCTLNEVMEKAPAVTEEAAEPDDVRTGKKYWGLTDGNNWGIKTGTGTGIDGGVECSTGTDRFADNNDGTVTDTCTKLIWLKNANCPNDKGNWNEIKTYASSLYDGWTGDGNGGDCGLSDGSSAGDWHLPSVDELQSLIDYSQNNPALPSGHPFSGVQPSTYWMATTAANGSGDAWNVDFNEGVVYIRDKARTRYVWPVRGRNHSCALTQTGNVKCWGNNSEGQVDGKVGDDTKQEYHSPKKIGGDGGVATIDVIKKRINKHIQDLVDKSDIAFQKYENKKQAVRQTFVKVRVLQKKFEEKLQSKKRQLAILEESEVSEARVTPLKDTIQKMEDILPQFHDVETELANASNTLEANCKVVKAKIEVLKAKQDKLDSMRTIQQYNDMEDDIDGIDADIENSFDEMLKKIYAIEEIDIEDILSQADYY